MFDSRATARPPHAHRHVIGARLRRTRRARKRPHAISPRVVRDICRRLGPFTILRVLDAYVDGTGLTKIGPVPQLGAEVDQAAWLAMWAEAIFWPRAWVIGGLQWEAIDERHARARLPFGPGEEVQDRISHTWDEPLHRHGEFRISHCRIECRVRAIGFAPGVSTRKGQVALF